MLIRLPYTLSVVLACVLAVVAAFLPWVSLDVQLPVLGSIGTITRYGYEGDGIITLLLGLLAAGFTAYLWIDRSAGVFRLVALFNAFVGAVIFATALVNLLDSQRALGDAQQQLGVDLEVLVGIDLQRFVDTGAGIYITIAAGAILTVASLVAFSAHRFAPAGLLATDIDAERHGSHRSCPDCGTDLPRAANYCLNCGRSLPSSPSGGGRAKV